MSKYRTIGSSWSGYRNQRKIPFLPLWYDYGNLNYRFFSSHDAEQHLIHIGVLKADDCRWDTEVDIIYYGS